MGLYLSKEEVTLLKKVVRDVMKKYKVKSAVRKIVGGRGAAKYGRVEKEGIGMETISYNPREKELRIEITTKSKNSELLLKTLKQCLSDIVSVIKKMGYSVEFHEGSYAMISGRK